VRLEIGRDDAFDASSVTGIARYPPLGRVEPSVVRKRRDRWDSDARRQPNWRWR